MPKDPAAVALGRKGGRARSPEKTAAARANGALGGRPRIRCRLCRQKAPRFTRFGTCAACASWRRPKPP